MVDTNKLAAQAPPATEDEAEQLQSLRTRLVELRKRANRLGLFRRSLFIFGFVTPIATSFFVAFLFFAAELREQALLLAFSGALYSVMFFAAGAILNVRQAELDVKELEDELDLRQMKSASLEQKAHKLLRIQQGQLTRYLEVILQQSRRIFFVGIGAMLVGVGVVVFTIWETKQMGPDFDTYQKAIVAAVGAIGAILTNYVAAIYLKMFTDIGLAVQKSVSSLSQSTNLNFANVLVANITTDEGRNDTLKQIAVGISKVGPG